MKQFEFETKVIQIEKLENLKVVVTFSLANPCPLWGKLWQFSWPVQKE